MPCSSRASQCDTRRPRPGAGVPAHRWILQGASAACRVAAVWPEAPERPAAPAAGASGLALAGPGGQDRGWLGGLQAGHGGQPTGVSPASQKPGLGFPVARLVVVCSLACGAVVAAAIGRITG